MTSATTSRTPTPPLIDAVVGRLLEWMVSSVEGIRERLQRATAR